MSNRTLLKTSAAVLMLGSLAACGGKNAQPDTPPVVVTPPTADSIQARISSAFAAIFNRGVDQDPVDPQTSDVPPLAPASDPIDN
jgi:predicted small lipoprotein YifL